MSKTKPFAVLVRAVALAVVPLSVPTTAIAQPSSSPPPDCHGSFNPYAYTPAALATCGISSASASVSNLPGGGHLYAYSDANGVVEETAMPPAGFDPATATAAQLEEYQYPARPTDFTGLELWLKLVSIPRQAPEPFVPVLTNGYEAVPSSNWSGYVGTSGAFTYAEGEYTEPSYNNSVCSGSVAVTWAGLGGYVGSSALAQDGTSHNTNLGNHQPWWELLPTYGSLQVFPQGGASSNGHVVVAVTDTGSNPGYVDFDVYDLSSNTTWQTSKPLNGLNPSGSAEVIAERPMKVGGGFPQLSDFQTFSVSYAAAGQNGGLAYPLDDYSTSPINMYENGSGGGDLLANVGSLGSGFADFWDHCS
jgi:hypothetical protein